MQSFYRINVARRDTKLNTFDGLPKYVHYFRVDITDRTEAREVYEDLYARYSGDDWEVTVVDWQCGGHRLDWEPEPVYELTLERCATPDAIRAIITTNNPEHLRNFGNPGQTRVVCDVFEANDANTLGHYVCCHYPDLEDEFDVQAKALEGGAS